jgi:GNAT superfamily N-acetyltransferase
VRRKLPGGFELDDDPARVDVAAVYDYLANESYWARGRPRETVERLIREADRVVGVYCDGRQIGFARAYLADFYVLPEFRGRGLGIELVREMVERGPYAGVKWLLHTSDAHDLYRKFGFDEPSAKVLERGG